MENIRYYWVRSLKIRPGRTNSTWHAASLYGERVEILGHNNVGEISDFEIGPPIISTDQLIERSRQWVEAQETLRDRFAMAALAGIGGLVAGIPNSAGVSHSFLCYQIADAMMAERLK